MDKFQKQWEELGEFDAYYGVLTEDKFKADNLDENVLDDFFRTGEEHVQKVWDEIETHFIKDFKRFTGRTPSEYLLENFDLGRSLLKAQ